MLQRLATAVSAVVLLAATAVAAPAEKLCSLPPLHLDYSIPHFPESAAALEVIQQHATASWYTDSMPAQRNKDIIANITTQCSEDSRLTLVIYGLPNKDCHHGYSTAGANKNTADYKQWLQRIVDGFGKRKMLYVLEPDAVGLLANNGCAAEAGYEANLKIALEMLTRNPNADVYLDVGFWALFNPSQAKGVAAAVKKLAGAGRLKGITLNTSNYRPNKQMAELCTKFQEAYGDTSLHCIVDTSRNFNDNPPSGEWCNARFGGIGRPPTSDTGYANLDYFIWIKPAGESDGECDGAGLTADAMKGPWAGAFFNEFFAQLWNNGYFVKELKHSTIVPLPRSYNTSNSTTPALSTATPPMPASLIKTPVTEAVSPASSASAPVTESSTQVSTQAPDNAATRASGSSAKLGGGTIALVVALVVSASVAGAVVVVRMRRKRLEVAKTPDASFVSMAA
jgi:cellulase/cellobiase CelA1